MVLFVGECCLHKTNRGKGGFYVGSRFNINFYIRVGKIRKDIKVLSMQIKKIKRNNMSHSYSMLTLNIGSGMDKIDMKIVHNGVTYRDTGYHDNGYFQ